MWNLGWYYFEKVKSWDLQWGYSVNSNEDGMKPVLSHEVILNLNLVIGWEAMKVVLKGMICLVEIYPYFERNLLYAIHHNFSLEKMKKISTLSPFHLVSLHSNFCDFITQKDTRESHQYYMIKEPWEWSDSIVIMKREE